ncbi:MAG: hypothetical protein QM581_05830 [Pseudomonas sp.]
MSPTLNLLLLDFDGVLAEYARPLRFAHLADSTGSTPERVAAALFDSGLETAYDGGELSTADYLRRLSEDLGAPVDEPTWIAARVAACSVDTRVQEMVQQVAARMPVAVLTNNGALMAGAVPLIVPALAEPLRGRVLCSGALGGRKPQAQVYERALARLGASAATTLFIDNLFVNVRGARAAGLHADTVSGAASMRRVLRRFGLV